jgi:signal transduction histidine kinase
MFNLKLGRFAQIFAFAALMGGLAWASMALTRQANAVSVVWPMDALAVAFCIRWGRIKAERVTILALTGLALMAANVVWDGSPLWLSVALPLLNIANMGIALAVVRRIGPPIEDPRSFCAFVAGPLLGGPVLTAAAAAALMGFGVPGADPGQVFVGWAFGAGLGMAVVGSFALTVGRSQTRRTDARGWVFFAAGQAVVLFGACCILLQGERPALFMLAPFLVVGAMSHRVLGGITAVALTSLVAVLATLLGRGPAQVALIASVDGTLLVQVLLATMVFTVLPVSALLQRLERYAIELDERRAKAEELNALKSRLLAYVSHEIRSPLSGVTTLAELLRDGHMGGLSDQQRDALNQITVTGAEVDALARDLTDSAAIESGKASVRLEPVQVGEAIRTAVHLARFRTSQMSAVLDAPTCDIDADEVRADPLRLRQILVNLMVNAAKYGGRPPVVHVTARRTAAGMVRFEVSDNGAGIPPEQRDALFHAFERLGQETTHVEGSGLGLALCHEMAGLQNGCMGVEDSDLGGMRFWVELPLETAAVSKAA